MRSPSSAPARRSASGAVYAAALALLLALLAAPVGHAQTPAPLGLGWEMDVRQIREALNAQDRPVVLDKGSPELGQLHLEGELDGFATTWIEVNLVRNRLAAVTGFMRDQAPEAVVQRWHELNERMRGRYGEPERIADAPEDAGSLQAQVKRVQEGDWSPMAVWPFADNVVVVTRVRTTGPTLLTMWMFAHRERMGQWVRGAAGGGSG